jgi:competence protein ComEC
MCGGIVREVCLIALIVGLSTPLSSALPNQIIFWNVGQGLWVTVSSPEACFHIDMGGEHFDSRKLSHECFFKKNFVGFSHWDWDHIGFALKSKSILKSLCLWRAPAGPRPERKAEFLSRLSVCQNIARSPASEVHVGGSPKKPNEWSRIFLVREQVLLPGDSTSKREKIWARILPERLKIKILALGHHGSKTSTSKFLLERLPQLKQAVGSARRARYGHPHLEVKRRLTSAGVALITTEIWGTIRFVIP